MADQTMGQKLLALKERSGLGLDSIAKAARYSRASSIQRYFNTEYDAAYLPKQLADRLKDALVGFGDPPITGSDVERLTEYGFMLDRTSPRPPLPEMFRRRSQAEIECNATVPDNSHAWEAELFRVIDDPVRQFVRPSHLARRAITALYVSTMGMAPRYRAGDIIVVEAERPAMIGQDVLVSVSSEQDGTYGFLATLVDRNREYVVVATLNPATQITIPIGDIDDVSPIMPISELLTPSFTH